MSPASLHQAVAQQTGESLACVTQRGFSLAVLVPAPSDHRTPTFTVGCPGCDRALPVTANQRETDPDDEFWVECPRCDAAFPFQLDELVPAVD